MPRCFIQWRLGLAVDCTLLGSNGRGPRSGAVNGAKTPAAKREAVAHLRSAFGMSELRACRTIGCVRMAMFAYDLSLPKTQNG